MSRQILIVDDEPNARLNYRIALETEGYAVTEANSGLGALEAMAARDFDLAIFDVRMPGMDGLELLAEARKRGFLTPTIVATAYGDVPHAVQAMKLGAIDFLEKPLTPGQLRQIAKEVIDRHEIPGAPFHAESNPPADFTAEEGFEFHMKEAKRLLNRREFAAAKQVLGKATAINPLSAEAFNLAGVLFEMREDFAQAKRFYSHALKLDSRHASAQTNLRRVMELCDGSVSAEPSDLDS